MIRRIRNFVERHPKKIATVAAIAVGTLAWKYARRRLERWHEEESRKLLDAARRRQHFEATLSTADTALTTLGPAVARTVCEVLDTTQILDRLQQLKGSRGAEWRAAWQELKDLTIARVVSLVYSQALLGVLLRVQLAVLAGQMFRQSQDHSNHQSQNAAPDLPPGVILSQDQLACCQTLVSEGVPQVCRVVAKVVARCPVVKDADLGQQITLQALEQILWAVQTMLCEEIDLDLLRNIARLAGAEGETRELLNTDEVWSLASSCVSRGLAHMVDCVAAFYSDPTLSEEIPIQSVRLPLAKVIPILDGMCRRAAGSSQSSTGVDFLHLLAGDEKLRTLSANIYEAFGDQEQCDNHRHSRGIS